MAKGVKVNFVFFFFCDLYCYLSVPFMIEEEFYANLLIGWQRVVKVNSIFFAAYMLLRLCGVYSIYGWRRIFYQLINWMTKGGESKFNFFAPILLLRLYGVHPIYYRRRIFCQPINWWQRVVKVNSVLFLHRQKQTKFTFTTTCHPINRLAENSFSILNGIDPTSGCLMQIFSARAV